MNFNLKIYTLLSFALFLVQMNAFAQENIAPLQYNPNTRAGNHKSYSTMKTTALSLPFFEDFTNYDIIPDTSIWLDRQVYINNTMAENMKSRGVATFDALNQYGLPYDLSSATIIRYSDSLTSKPFDLSTYSPSDSIYLSFVYQPGGLGFTPEKQDSLMLFFKSKISGSWIKVWSKSDSVLQDFKIAMVKIADTNFLHSGFQFRFINKASLGINDDVWNLDYIKIDAGRNLFDTLIQDVAYTQNPTSILSDYTAMPYRQYLAASGAERASTFKSIIKNNFQSSQNVSSFGYEAKEQVSGTGLSSGADVNRNIPALKTSDVVFNTYSTTPSAAYYDKVIFENKFYLQAPAGDVNKVNDTIRGTQIFDNYLAYDDGTAEMSYYLNLFPTLPGKIAIEHHLNQADTLRGMAIYFGRQVPLASYKYFSGVVYKSIAYGSSASDNIIYQIDNLQPKYIDTINHFWIYKFDKPVPMPSGTFYIGTIQPALSGSDSLYFGLDRNRTSGNHAYFNVLNTWSPSLVSGAIMIRPILGQPISGSEIKEVSAAQFNNYKLSPNPASDKVTITMNQTTYNSQYSISNSLGQHLQQGIVASPKQEINLSALPDGIYFMHLENDGKQYPVQKFIKQ